jgi:EmrB/QacA subfamily drug resistance transporter
VPNFVRTPCGGIATCRIPSPTAPTKYEKWTLLATILGSSMAFIDGTIVNVALAAIQEALHAPISQLQWVVEAYALTLASLLIVGGSLGDIYGRRIIFLIGIIIFTVGSIGCGLSLTMMHLLISRAIQGVGASLLVPGSLALISAAFPEERRGQAIGTWAAFTSITTASGPVIGGWLVQHASWRWVFFINVPLAIIVFVITLAYVEESKNEQRSGKLDILGSILIVIGLGALVFGFIEWQKPPYFIFIAEIIGVCAFLGFFWVEVHSSSPMLPFKIFRSRNFSAANIITFFLYFALQGLLFFLPLNLIQVQGYTPTQTGAALLPFILLIFLLSRLSGGLVKKIGPRLPLVIGPVVAAVGYTLFIFANRGGSYWTSFFPAAVVLGLGMAICVAPLTTAVMNSVGENYVGSASGVNNAVAEMASLWAIAILGLIMTMIFNQQLENKLKIAPLPLNVKHEIIIQKPKLADIKTTDKLAHQLVGESFIAGYKTVLQIAAVLALLSSLTAWIFVSNKELSVKLQ